MVVRAWLPVTENPWNSPVNTSRQAERGEFLVGVDLVAILRGEPPAA